MDTLTLITQMFAAIAFGALIWLSVRAFKTHPGWGFTVLLFSPFSATVFGVQHWKEQREPFLLFITTFTATFALCIYLFTVSGGLGLSASLQHGIPAQTLAASNNDNLMQASYSVHELPVNTHTSATEEINTAQDEKASAEETAIPQDEAVAEKKKRLRYRLTYIPIKLSDVKNYIGITAKIARKNVREKEYLITAVSPRDIELAQHSKGGNFSFHFKNSDIDHIRVLVNEAY